MKQSIFIAFIVIAALTLIAWNFRPHHYLVTGTGNPGTINLYDLTQNSIVLKKTFDTGFQFVYTIRLGDIYNDGKINIIAGVSNSFYRNPYGCKVIAYDIQNFKQSVIDDVGDLRCKDLTIGDADNDGKNEVILGTHGEGIVKVYKWEQHAWNKTVLETNYIAKVDAQNNTNHRVPNSDLPCQTCVIQTAVHIVKIGDVDNDGKNEIVTSMSSPLELQSGQEISFIRVYRKSGNSWTGQTVDSITSQEYRSITIADIDSTGKNTLLVGTGSPRNVPGSLLAYDFAGGNWHKRAVHKDAIELNMKGLDVGEIGSTPRSILLATGFPNANIMTFHWGATGFSQQNITSIRSLFDLPDAQFNAMVAGFIPDENGAFIVGGNTMFPKQNIGFEATDKGFLVRYSNNQDRWVPTIINTNNILAFDTQ